ncbi:MAG: sodium:solute symporter family protein [Xanthomonadales bacterium]|jgi:sodium/pantothenate symporter|nr:sodium:solute symporter family protein [Xanthomonadales bacterium]
MDIYASAILLSLVAYVLIGNYAGRRVKRLEDYFVAGRQAPTLLIVGTLVASIMSTNAFLGETGFVYEGQAGAYLLWPGIAATFYVWGVLLFGRYLRRSRALTVADYFGQRFASRRVQIAAGVTIILGLGGYLLAVTQGAAYLLTQVMPVSYHQALVISWLTYTGFTLYAGTRGVVITDTLMFLLFTFVAFFALVFLIGEAGGMSAAVGDLARLPEKRGLMSWTGIVGDDSPFRSGLHFALWNVTLALAWGLVYAVSPWQSSRYLVARDEHVAIRAACIAAVCLAFLEITLYFGGAVVNLWDATVEPPHQVMIFAARELLPPLLGAGLLAGIMAAALSSASTFLSLVGFSVSNDLFPHRTGDEAQLLRWSRWTMLGVGLVALAVAFPAPVDLFWLTYFVGTLFASSWGPVALMSVWSRRITADAAFWGIISGFVFNAGPKALVTLGWLALPYWLDPVLLGGLVSLAVVLLVSRLGSPSRAEQRYRLRMHRTPAEERDPNKFRRTRRLPFLLVVYAFGFAALFALNYLPAFRRATGEAARAEALLLGIGPVLWTLTAVVAWWVIGRSYGVKPPSETSS